MRTKGFTLIEILVAVVIFSFGLLGVGGLMTISVRNNHNGYLRSQANFLAENMIDRMRANPVALWRGNYDGSAVPGGSVCTLANSCEFSALALYDTEQWAQSLASTLPSGTGVIACDTLGAAAAAETTPDGGQWAAVKPFEGICTITVNWVESNGGTAPAAQTLVLVAQP